MKKIIACLAMALTLLPTAAMAGELKLTPIASEGKEIRYLQGVPTVSEIDEQGGVLVTQTDPIYGRVRLMVALTNDTDNSVNFGVENITATLDGKPVPVLTADRLQSIAKNKAGWAMFAVAMAGGLSAVAAHANSTRTYTTTGYTPYGAYRSHTRIYDPTSATIGAAAATAGSAYAISRIDQNLQSTIAGIKDEVVQTTTIDPKSNYGGMIVLDKFKIAKGAPGLLELEFRRSPGDAEGYKVAFNVAKKK